MHSIKHLATALILALICVACQQQRDRNGILSERAMVDVLYDYQLALALAAEEAEQGKQAETEYRYTQAVLRKHQITDQEFQLSIAHYARDPKTMLDITKRVTKRFEEQGGTMGDAGSTAEDGIAHDTLILYRNIGGIVLTANGHNRHSVSISVPQNVETGRLVISFVARWIYREGVKSGGVLVTTQFDNDSTACIQEGIREYGFTQGITIPVPPGRRAKTVTLDFVQNAQWSKTQQVLALDDVALRAIVAARPKQAAPAPTKSNEPAQPVKDDSVKPTAADTAKQ